MYIRYLLKNIEPKLFKGRAIVIYGPRRVGKTTLMKEIGKKYKELKSGYVTGDDSEIISIFESNSLNKLTSFIGDTKILMIDEAQRIPNIGLSIKLIVDNIPNVQLIVSGSSTFELNTKIIEPMTGRAYIFEMYPMSLEEISLEKNIPKFQFNSLLEELLVYGNYPTVNVLPLSDKKEELELIRNQYLFKDVLEYKGIKKSDLIENLAKALAFQVGSEVNYLELSSLLGVDKDTIQKYISLLEQNYIIFRLYPLNKFPRKEIGRTKSRKVYFYDNGILNILRGNTSPINLRDDRGSLFENFLISERIKRNAKLKLSPYKYYWRDYDGNEIDYLEENDSIINSFEFKFNNEKPEKNKKFDSLYPKAIYQVINKENWSMFLN